MLKKTQCSSDKTENRVDPVAAFIPILKSHLIELNYAPNTIRLHCSAVKSFGHWLSHSNATLIDINEETIKTYIEEIRVST